MISGFSGNNRYKINSRHVIAIIGAVSIFSFLTASMPSIVENVEAQTQERRSNVITITGSNVGEIVVIDEDNSGSEICTHAGVVVSGPGVTSLGQTSECPNNPPYGWDISPNTSGVNTRYEVIGNGVSAGGLNVDRVEVHDGSETDNDRYSLDVNQFILYDGPGNDRYDLVGDLVDFGESVLYSDSTGRDRVSFVERG